MRLASIPGWVFTICIVGPVLFLVFQAIRPKKGPE